MGMTRIENKSEGGRDITWGTKREAGAFTDAVTVSVPRATVTADGVVLPGVAAMDSDLLADAIAKDKWTAFMFSDKGDLTAVTAQKVIAEPAQPPKK